MTTRVGSWLIAFSFGLSPAAQSDAADLRRALGSGEASKCLRALMRLGDGEIAMLESCASGVVALLADGDPRVRAAALAVVRAAPPAFARTRAQLVAAVTAGQSREPALAFAAVAPFFAIPPEVALELLANARSSTDLEHAKSALMACGESLLPRASELARHIGVQGGRVATEVLKALADSGHRDEVFAAIVAAMPAVRSRAHALRRVLEQLGARPEVEIPALLEILRQPNDHGAARRLAKLARDDAELRAKIAELCASSDLRIARRGLETLREVGPAAADQWPAAVPCLQSGELVWSAAAFAKVIGAAREDVVVDLIAAIDGATPRAVASLASALPSCGDSAIGAGSALAMALPGVDDVASRVVADALLAIGATDELRGALPGLLARTDPAIRAHACVLAAIAAPLEPELVAMVAAFESDEDVLVRDAARFAERMLDVDAEISIHELVDFVADRDLHRVAAALARLRRAGGPASQWELEALRRVLGAYRGDLLIWARRFVDRDFRSGRIAPGQIGALLADSFSRGAA